MNILLNLLLAILPRLIDYFLKKRRFEGKTKKQDMEVFQQKKRLYNAIEAGFNGEPISGKEKDEMLDAARDLITGY